MRRMMAPAWKRTTETPCPGRTRALRVSLRRFPSFGDLAPLLEQLRVARRKRDELLATPTALAPQRDRLTGMRQKARFGTPSAGGGRFYWNLGTCRTCEMLAFGWRRFVDVREPIRQLTISR